MRIRNLEKKDIKGASEIVRRNYNTRYQRNSAREMRAMFGNPVIPPKYVVAEENGKIMGCGGYIQSWMDYNIYNIFWINVDPSRQRQGIGTKIVGHIIADIRKQKGADRKASTILLTTDKPGFYRKRFGFRTIERFKDKYHHLMCLELRNKSNGLK